MDYGLDLLIETWITTHEPTHPLEIFLSMHLTVFLTFMLCFRTILYFFLEHGLDFQTQKLYNQSSDNILGNNY